MSNDFWAGYLSGAIGIVIGNPLEVLKVRLQASNTPGNVAVSTEGTGTAPPRLRGQFESTSSLVRGAAAPILGYGALNALLFVAYNRTLACLVPSVTDPTDPVGAPLHKIWLAGAVGGLASWVISSPTELVKCRAQLSSARSVSSWAVTKEIIKTRGLRGLYFGGGITSVRDSVGYGFYFGTYEFCKRVLTAEAESSHQEAAKILFCGGIAGMATWASVFPLDVIKTRLQAQTTPGSSLQSQSSPDRQPLIRPTGNAERILSTVEVAKQAFRSEGLSVFYRGLGVCSLRAFIVNAVQWATYEWIMRALSN